MNFTFYSDSGHGWLEVPLSMVKRVGHTPSRYSYYNPKTQLVYLEEDCDAPAFDEKFKATFGSEPVPVFINIEGDAFIRSLPRAW